MGCLRFMLQHSSDICPLHTGKPLQKLIHSGPGSQVLKKSRDWNPSSSKNESSTQDFWVRFNRRQTGPVTLHDMSPN